jgi:signal-transduction protein with cAMP-binding, CBS, and nucleotidyltransferase domain
MSRLKDLLRDRPVSHLEPECSVADAARRMSELRVGAILVLEQGQLRGLFSERDLMTRVVAAGRDPERTLVREVMSTELATIGESASSDEAMEMMRRNSCRHLPVLGGAGVAGLISMRDLMNYELERKTEEIQHMRAYITGNG